jgi:hypothetical protein
MNWSLVILEGARSPTVGRASDFVNENINKEQNIALNEEKIDLA